MTQSFLPPLAPYPTTRLRRNRRDPWSRKLVAESVLTAGDLIWPVFVHDEDGRAPVPSMPDAFRLSIPALVDAAGEAAALGIPTDRGVPGGRSGAEGPGGAARRSTPDNLVCRAVAALKQALPDLGVLCDVALDPFTSHGHDGVIRDGYVANDETVAILQRQAIVQAEAGCDIIAPSDMMDGRVGAVRRALDEAGFDRVRIMSYAAKYASCFLRPVPRRDRLGDRARQRRQAHLPDGPGQRRRGAARGRARHRRGRRHGHGQARHALSRHRAAREGRVPRADLRLPGVAANTR